MTTTINCDPIVVLAYDEAFAVTRASRLDSFEAAKGLTTFYRSVAAALRGFAASDHVSIDVGSGVTAAQVRRAGLVPVKWHDGNTHASTGWVEA